MKKLYYFTTLKIPNARAHSIQIMNMCHAFSAEAEVTLFVGVKKYAEKEIFDFYTLPQTFSIVELGLPFGGRLKFVSDIIMAWKAWKFARKNSDGVMFVREPILAYVLSFFTNNFFCEVHTLAGRSRFFFRRVASRVRGVISTNQYKKDFMVREWNIAPERILVAHNGVDVASFARISEDRATLRARLGLPQDKILLGHIGRLSNKGIEKGAEFVIDAAAKTHEPRLVTYFIGCTEEEIQRHSYYVKKAGLEGQFIFLGHVKHEQVPDYIHAMDIVLLLQAKSEAATFHTSSLKSFEYMASGVPVLVTKLPSLQEFFDDTTALFFEAEDVKDFTKALSYAITHRDEMQSRAQRALEHAWVFDWSRRREAILQFIDERNAA